jgi:para-nitrobenzyl esterase
MLIGSTRNEFSPSLGNPALEDIGEDGARAMAQAGTGSPAAWTAFRAAYPKAKPVELLSIVTSSRFTAPAVVQAQRKAAQGKASAWLYRFDYNPPVLDGRARAFHCAELAYCFDNVDRCLNATGGGPNARALAAKMADAWIAFARTGDPNHKGLPRWPAVGATARPVMLFDVKCGIVDDPDAKARAAFVT